MNPIIKVGGASAIGVTIPLASEMGLKGMRVGVDPYATKVSGLIGIAEGIGGLGGAYYYHKKAKKAEDVAALAALGGAGLATGVSICLLDYARAQGQYAFRKDMERRLRDRGGNIPLSRQGLEELRREEQPVSPMVEEI